VRLIVGSTTYRPSDAPNRITAALDAWTLRKALESQTGRFHRAWPATAMPRLGPSDGGWGFFWYPNQTGRMLGRPPAFLGYAQAARVQDYRFTAIAVPWWSLALLFAIAPALAAWRWRRPRPRPTHECPACGYDLRATPDPAGPRLPACPECGERQ
jgi:hypothetical protein